MLLKVHPEPTIIAKAHSSLSRTKVRACFWNMFDQLLVRPELLSSFKNENLQILTSAGNSKQLGATSLLTKACPDFGAGWTTKLKDGFRSFTSVIQPLV